MSQFFKGFFFSLILLAASGLQADQSITPWFAGPLLTGSAHCVPPGSFDLQPYLFFTTNYEKFDDQRKSTSTDNTYAMNMQSIFQLGLINRVDFSTVLSFGSNNQSSQTTFGIEDFTAQVGFQLVKESPSFPALRLIVSEKFPTGAFSGLDAAKKGTDGFGEGSYQTGLGLNISKTCHFFPSHPIQLRSSMSYFHLSSLDVKGLNVYGGGANTDGTVSPGNKISLSNGVEISLNQNWVFAFDLAYSLQKKSTFKGTSIEAVGKTLNDQLSFAPAIEYNMSQNVAFLAGAWFAITGRNSPNFASGVLSFNYAW